jgi:hypothetical protein
MKSSTWRRSVGTVNLSLEPVALDAILLECRDDRAAGQPARHRHDLPRRLP